MAEPAFNSAQDIANAAGVPQTAVEPEHLLESRGVSDVTNPGNSAAAALGRRTGRAVSAIRQFRPRSLPASMEGVREQVRDSLRIIRQRIPGDITNPVEQLRDKAACTIDTLLNRAQERVQLLRNRADRLQRERPVELIVGAFGAAFLMGTALRIWRSNGD
jgi:hypothetical protein